MRSTRTRLGVFLLVTILAIAVGVGVVVFLGGNDDTKTSEPTVEVSRPTPRVEKPAPQVSEPTQGVEETIPEATEPTFEPEEPTIAVETPTVEPTAEPTVTVEPTVEPTPTATVEPTPDISDSAYVEDTARKFLVKRGVSELLSGQSYRLVVVEGPDQGWIVLTVAFHDDSWPEGIGAGGMIATGRVENNDLVFHLPGDEGFSSLVEELPEPLLPESLKQWYSQETLSSFTNHSLVSLGLTEQPVFYLPYREGEKYRITVLPGNGHHTGDHSYAIDLGLPEGTPIAASAGGKVLSFKDDSDSGGCNTSYDKDANYILIEITPGDAILYLHLQVGSVTANNIQVGQTVEAGQIIGAAGSTGFTCNSNGRGAHLHIERGKPYNNLKRMEVSTPLTFVEFGPEDPRYNIEYISQNLSPEERRAQEEERRRQEQLTEEEKARQPIETAFDNFNKVYWCSRVVGCSEADVAEELKYVTEKVRSSLFDVIFCLFCPPKDDKLETYGEVEYISFPVPTPDATSLEIRVKSAAKATIGDEVTYHFTVTNVFFIKEDGQWKVDGWETTCGYVTNEVDGKPGEVIYTENLEGCEWQPPSSGSW